MAERNFFLRLIRESDENWLLKATLFATIFVNGNMRDVYRELKWSTLDEMIEELGRFVSLRSDTLCYDLFEGAYTFDQIEENVTRVIGSTTRLLPIEDRNPPQRCDGMKCTKLCNEKKNS